MGSAYFSATRRSTMDACWRPKGRCDAMGTARGVPVHSAKALNRKNATASRSARFLSGFLSSMRDIIIERR